MNKIALLIVFTVPSMLSGMEIVEVIEQPTFESSSEPNLTAEERCIGSKRPLSPSFSAPTNSFLKRVVDDEGSDKNSYHSYDMIVYHPYVRDSIKQMNEPRKLDPSIDYATYSAWLSKYPKEREKWEKVKAAPFFDKLCALGVMRMWAPYGLDSKPMRIRIEFKRKYTIAELPKHNDAMVEFEPQPE